MGLEPPGDPENSTHPTFLEPSIVKARVSHSLDVATNFPAAILTIVAFMNPEVVPPGTGWIFLAIVAVAITMATYGIAPIKFAGRYNRLSLKWVSPYSVALIVANSFGLVTVLT